MSANTFATEINLDDRDDRDYIETFINEGQSIILSDDYEEFGAELINRD